jgi:hypothetical protein
VSMLDNGTDPTERPAVTVATAVHGSSNPVGLLSYTIENQAAVSDISRASEPGLSACINGMRGQTLTPSQILSVLETTEIQSLAYIPVPTLDKKEALPKRRTLPSGSL